jgi:hypothetical protein
MSKEFKFTLKSIRFDEDYRPSDNTRITTNFANLARGESRQQNLRNTLKMIDNRFNTLAHWDNPNSDRYSVELEIISVEMKIDAESNTNALPLIEILKTNIVDKKPINALKALLGIIFLLTYVTMILVCYCLIIIKISLNLKHQKILVIYTETCSRALLTQIHTKLTLKNSQ